MSQPHQLSQIVQALKALNSDLRVSPFGSHQVFIGLESRQARVGWAPSAATFFGEFWLKDVRSGKLLTRSSDVALSVVQAWLLSGCTASELNRLHTEFRPTEEGLAVERGNLLDVRWSLVAESAPHTMKDFVAAALSQPQLRSAYPMFSLDRLLLLSTPDKSGEIASVRRADGNCYQVLDSKLNSLGTAMPSGR
jgi:hypothetical protein